MMQGIAPAVSFALLTALGARAQEARIETIARAIIASHVPARDDPDHSFHELLRTAIAAPSTAASSLLIEEAGRWMTGLQDPDAALRLLRSYRAKNPHGLGAQAALVLQAGILRRAGRAQDARRLHPYQDHASTMLVIGPFGDSDSHYLGVTFGPELRFPAPGTTLPGRFGPVQPRLVRRRAHRPMIRLVDPVRGRTGCFYALHQVTAKAATACYVELACSGSFELWVNGERVGGLDRYHLRVPLIRRIPVVLARGRNRVLVKTEIASVQEISLRYVDAAGRTLVGVAEVEDPDRLGPLPEPQSDLPRPGPFLDGLAALEQALRSSKGKSRRGIELAACLSAERLRDSRLTMAMLDALEAKPTADPPTGGGVAALALAKAIQGASLLPAETRRSRARALIDGLDPKLSTHHSVVMARAGELHDEDRREEAIALLQTRVAAGLAGPQTYQRLSGLLAGLHFAAEARRLRDHWRAARPMDTQPILSEASTRSRGGDVNGALELLLSASRRLRHPALLRRILELATDRGDRALATRMLGELHADDPDSIQALADRARHLERLGEKEKALDLQARIAKDARASAGFLATAGAALLRGGRSQAALAAYEKALELDPSHHALRRLVHRLRGEPDFPMIARFRRDGEAILAAFEPGQRERSAHSSLLLDQMIVRVNEDGSTTEETHQIRRINDLAGVEKFQEARDAANADEVVLLRTIGKDKRSYVPNRVQGSFSMPRLEPGAFIEQIYRRHQDSPEPGPWRATTFFFRSADAPFLDTEIAYILPPHPRGSFRVRNFPGKPLRQRLDHGYTARVFRLENVPRLENERGRPALEDIIPVVAYGEDGSTSAHARNDFASATYRAYASPVVTRRARELSAGLTGDRAKVEKIHAWVQQAIPTSRGASDPTSILLQKKGPRFFLEVALLAEANIPFHHAVVAPAREELTGLATPLFLGEDTINRLAVRIEPRDGPALWLLADAPRYFPLGSIPASRAGASALILDAGQCRLSRLPPGSPDQSGVSVRGKVALDADDRATLEATVRIRGSFGFAVADQIRNLEENRQTVVARQLIGQFFPGWSPSELGFVDLDRPGRGLTAHAKLTRAGALEKAGADWLMALPLGRNRLLASFGARGGRKLPFRLTSLYVSSWDILLDPGTHRSFTQIPRNVAVRHMLLDYSITFQRVGRKLAIHREVYQKPGQIPAAQFGEWLGLLRRLDLAEEVRLKLR